MEEEGEVVESSASGEWDVFSDSDDDAGLAPAQVEALLSTMCEATDVAQLEIEAGSFRLFVRRSVEGSGSGAAAPAPAAPAPAAAPAAAPAPVASAPVDRPSPAAGPATPEEEEASFVVVPAPFVGTVRRGRYGKGGKRVGAANIAEVGDVVKKGQTIGMIEELGTFHPVQAPQSGKIEKFLVQDGHFIGYHQTYALLMPFFGA